MDVSHELGALRFVVDSPLSSKVAMFNQQVDQHKQSQLLNPFSQTDGRASPKPSFSKDEYGKPLAGSLTEMRGQKANIHVLKEMLELCQIIDSEGYNVKDEPTMRVIPFGELFNIYNYISDKVVGILLRARKHKLVEFEGEMLFQRRDDDVPIFLIKPIHEIRREMNDKIDSIKRCGSPAPQATSVLLDKRAHGLDVPKGTTSRSSVSRTPSPQTSKAGTPTRDTSAKPPKPAAATVAVAEPSVPAKVETSEGPAELAKPESTAQNGTATEEKPTANNETQAEQPSQPLEPKEELVKENAEVQLTQTQPQPSIEATQPATEASKIDVNNNNNNNNNTQTNSDLPTIIIEATAVYENAGNNTQETTAAPTTTIPAPTEPTTVEPVASVEAPASA